MNLMNMLTNHAFWGVLTLAVLAWYSTVTIYVAIRGAFDIQHMLRSLSARDKTGGKKSPDDGSRYGS